MSNDFKPRKTSQAWQHPDVSKPALFRGDLGTPSEERRAMSDEVKMFSSDVLRGLGEIKRCCGKGVYPGGDIELDGMIDGEMTIKIRCSFADAQRIAEAAGKILAP